MVVSAEEIRGPYEFSRESSHIRFTVSISTVALGTVSFTLTVTVTILKLLASSPPRSFHITIAGGPLL